MERGPFEGRPMAPVDQQQMRPVQQAPPPPPPGYPGGFQEAPGPNQHNQHHRHPSGPVLHEGPVALLNGYVEPRDRVAQQYPPQDERMQPYPHQPYTQHERIDPRQVAPGQRHQNSLEADQRRPSNGQQHYPHPAMPEHDSRQPQFVGHERQESFQNNVQVHPPVPNNRPDLNALGPPGPRTEDPYPPHHSEIVHGHPEKHRASFDSNFNAPRPPSITQQEPPQHMSMMRQAPDPRHPGAISPTSHQPHQQQPGYPPDGRPQVSENQLPYSRPASQSHNYGPEMRRGPDVYHPEDQQRGNGQYPPYSEPPQSWPPRNSPPSRGNWDPIDSRHQGHDVNTMNRRVDNAPPEFADRPVVNMKGIPQPDHDIPVHGSVPNMPHPNQMMGKPGYASQLGVMPGAEMVGRQNLSPPAIGPISDTPPGSTRALSPDVNTQSDRVKKVRKTKGKVGGENGKQLEMSAVSLEGSVGRQTPNPVADMAPEQQTPSKRVGRKPKSDSERREAILKPWSVITPESHRRSISHAEAQESANRQAVEMRDKAQFGPDQSRMDEHAGSALMSMHKGDADNAAAQQGMQSGAILEGAPLPSKPGHEQQHQRQTSAQYGRPPPPSQYPHSVDEFERAQRMQQQQQQHSIHYQNPQPSQHIQQPYPGQYGSPQYTRQQGPESMGSAPDPETQRAGSGKATGSAPTLMRPGKEPEVAQHIEDAAAALVNIQHVNRFQSPESAAHTEAESHKKIRVESPIDSRPDQHHRGPAFPSPEGDMRGRIAPRDMRPAPIGRTDLEQEVTIILHGMSQTTQQEVEAERLEHGEPAPHQFPQRYAPRSPSPPGQMDPREHRGPYPHQIPGVHLQQNDHSPSDHHQLAAEHVAHEQRLQQMQHEQMQHEQMQHEQMQRHHQQQPMPAQQGVPPPPFTRAPEHSNFEPPVFDPHRVAAEGEQNDRTLQQSLGGPTGHPQQALYDPHAPPGYVGDDHDRFRNTAGFVADGKDRGNLVSHQSFPADSPIPRPPNTPHEPSHWSADSPTHNRRVAVDPSLHAHQQSPQQSLYQPQHQSHQQHQHQYSPHPHPPSQSYPSEQAAHTYGNGVAMNAHAATSAGPEHAEAGLVSANTTVLSKPKATKNKGKPKNALKISSDPFEVHQRVQEFDGRVDQASFDDNSSSVNASPSSSRRRSVKREESISDRSLLLDGNSSTNGGGTMGPDMTPDRLLFGSGMILIRGSAQFPPPRLSIKTSRNYGPASEPSSATSASSATPLSATPIKNKRSRMLLGNGERDSQNEETAEPPYQPQSTKTEMAEPPSSPFAMTPTKPKSANRTKKGGGSSGSIDADIERSNQITRSLGPAWMTLGSVNTSGLNSSSNNTSPTTLATQTKTGDTGATANGSGARRRLPITSSTSTNENEKRKPKRIKIEEKDVRQVQRSSSLLADMTDGERKEDGLSSSQGSNGSKRSYNKRSGPSKEGNDRGRGNDGRQEGEDEDEVLEEGERNGGNCAGVFKRRSPDDDDEEGDDDTNTAGGGSNGNGSNGDAHGQSRGSAGGSGRKNVKRKSNSNLSSDGSTKKTKGSPKSTSMGPSADASFSNTKESMSADESANNSADGQTKLGRPRKQPNSNRKLKERSLSIANGTADSEAEIEYLPMEDDIECPQMFGIDDMDQDKGLTTEEEIEDDGQETESESKSVSTPSGSRKSSDSLTLSKTGETSDIPDDIQKQGREWVSKLSMPESAWEESYKTYERVKRLKELKNRQPVRKRDAILAAILLIICRDQGSPRTFSEVCAASGVKRGDIGAYYRLMQKILKPSMNMNASARDTDAEAFMTRWCESLSLSPQVRQAAVHVFSIANTLNLTSGKCPSSVGAAAIYLCIYAWNDARRLANCQRYQCSGCQCQALQGQSHPGLTQDQGWIKKEAKDVAVAVGVVSATLMGCYKNLAPEKEKLIPSEFLRAAVEGI
ncbi:Transcription initiation factor IIB [Mortierella sp. AD094]|nr:Transcription initiation factor IIB [Mortierella sp. AD094]